ncbi:MAG: sec-independent translocase [Aeromicrobium sp.]
MGWPELVTIGVVGVIVFGPDKLPDIARQAGQFIRTMRRMAENAKNDLGREIGQDFSGLQLRDLDPREVVRKNLLEIADDSPGVKEDTRALRPGEQPPFDPDAT